jgi:hypothetical protein
VKVVFYPRAVHAYDPPANFTLKDGPQLDDASSTIAVMSLKAYDRLFFTRPTVLLCEVRMKRLLCAALLSACGTLTASAQLVFQAPDPVALHAGEGAVLFTLTNLAGTSPTPLSLTAGPVLDTATHSIIAGAVATLSATVGTLPTIIAPGQVISLKASVTGVASASDAEFAIFNAGSRIGIITEFASDAALGITLEGAGALDKPLAYTRGNPVSLSLKNGDARPYHLHWDFQIDNQSEASDDFYILPGGVTQITFMPKAQRFSAVDLIHPSQRQGVLLLSVLGPHGVPPGLLPARRLPVSLVMQMASLFLTMTSSYAYVVLLLLLGGFLSFLGSSLLPNMQRKGDLKAQVKDLANRTSTISTRIDSYLRVLLRLERSRIANLIEDAPAWNPVSVDQLNIATVLIGTLSKRIAGAEQLDDLRRKHEAIAATAPPSVTDGIDLNLQSAADALKISALTDTDVAAARSFFAKAQASLDMLVDTDALARQIANNVAIAMNRIDKFPPNYYDDLRACLPGIFLIVDPRRGYSDAKNIVRPMLFAIDHGAAAIQIALDYAMIRASIPVMPTATSQAMRPPVDQNALGNSDQPPTNAAPSVPGIGPMQCDQLGEAARERLLQRQCNLIQLLGTLSGRALREASLLIQEMREDVYEEDILKEIGKPNQAEITFDTQKTRPFQPVFFSIQFKDSRFNSAAALERLLCEWKFPDELFEHTWHVCHYFSGCEPATIPPVSATQPAKTHGAPCHAEHADAGSTKRSMRSPFAKTVIRKSFDIYATISGKQANKSPERYPPLQLMMVVQIQSSTTTERSRLWAEVLQFAIAFGVALAGLLSGALDQLYKLDIMAASIAIIGLGFGASSIKNLLTQSNHTATTTPATHAAIK